MKKKTDTDYRILPVIADRWSPRVFDNKSIEEIDLRTLFEAGRWAPSSNNIQPWVIIWGIKGTSAFDRIFNCLDEFNQSWAKNAQAFVLAGYKKTNNDDIENFHALHDLGLFMGNVSVQAQHMGIGLHQMAGVNYEKSSSEFKLPEGYHIATCTAVGYYGGDISKLPEDLQGDETKSRSRKNQASFTFNGDFNEDTFKGE